MTSDQIAASIQEKIFPQLSELGVETFVLAGYIRSGDDKVERLVIVNGGGNVAHQDGMSFLVTAAAQRGAQGLKPHG